MFSGKWLLVNHDEHVLRRESLLKALEKYEANKVSADAVIEGMALSHGGEAGAGCAAKANMTELIALNYEKEMAKENAEASGLIAFWRQCVEAYDYFIYLYGVVYAGMNETQCYLIDEHYRKQKSYSKIAEQPLSNGETYKKSWFSNRIKEIAHKADVLARFTNEDDTKKYFELLKQLPK